MAMMSRLIRLNINCCEIPYLEHHFQHSIGHITTGSFVGRGNQYIQLIKILYCKLSIIGKQLPTFPHKVLGLNTEVGGECVTGNYFKLFKLHKINITTNVVLK